MLALGVLLLAMGMWATAKQLQGVQQLWVQQLRLAHGAQVCA